MHIFSFTNILNDYIKLGSKKAKSFYLLFQVFWKWELEMGLWKWDFGNGTLEMGLWKWDFGNGILEMGFWKWDFSPIK